MQTRNEAFAAAPETEFDAVVVGAGISGIATYKELLRRGYRALLIDKGDFSGGTSQASGMLVWGGLLYLRNLDLRTVWDLSAQRDALLADAAEPVRTLRFRYLPLRTGGRSRALVHAALWAYWLLGRRRRERPYGERHFSAEGLLAPDRFRDSLVYEEAALTVSDARFGLGWLFDQGAPAWAPLNYCGLDAGRWDGRGWELDVTDQLTEQTATLSAKVLINAGGVWTESVNAACGVASRYRHALSKGVYLVLKRPPELAEALVFESGLNGDSQTFTPWGPVALWGPTETLTESIAEGFAPKVEDLRFLLAQANQNLAFDITPDDIVALRCGIRPLAVKRDFRAARYPLDLSRRHVVERDPQRAALTLYGGKLTSAPGLARKAVDLVAGYIAPRGNAVPPPTTRLVSAPVSALKLPGFDHALPDPAWCVDHEGCATVEDYLRRRTNIAQWIPGLGLGRDREHLPTIRRIAEAIHTRLPARRSVQEDLDAWCQRADHQTQLIGAI